MGLVTSAMAGTVPMKTIVPGDDRAAGGNVNQPLHSPMGNRAMLQQQLSEVGNAGGEAVSLGARMFPSTAAASGSQWRPQTPGVTFPSQSETVFQHFFFYSSQSDVIWILSTTQAGTIL
jgi:hypothetical protein